MVFHTTWCFMLQWLHDLLLSMTVSLNSLNMFEYSEGHRISEWRLWSIYSNYFTLSIGYFWEKLQLQPPLPVQVNIKMKRKDSDDTTASDATTATTATETRSPEKSSHPDSGAGGLSGFSFLPPPPSGNARSDSSKASGGLPGLPAPSSGAGNEDASTSNNNADSSTSSSSSATADTNVKAANSPDANNPDTNGVNALSEQLENKLNLEKGDGEKSESKGKSKFADDDDFFGDFQAG